MANVPLLPTAGVVVGVWAVGAREGAADLPPPTTSGVLPIRTHLTRPPSTILLNPGEGSWGVYLCSSVSDDLPLPLPVVTGPCRLLCPPEEVRLAGPLALRLPGSGSSCVFAGEKFASCWVGWKSLRLGVCICWLINLLESV